jgi:hypothetical protein
MDEASYLRAKAAQCRRLAKSVTDETTVRALEEMAREFEQRALAIEKANEG